MAGDRDDSQPGAWVHALDGIGLLSDLPADALRALELKCEWLHRSEGETIVGRSDSSIDVFFIVQGKVRVMNYLGKERDIALADLGAGDHFGDIAAVDGRQRSAQVVGTERCVLARLDRDDFLALVVEHSSVAMRLLERYTAIIRSLSQRVSSLSALTPRQRIYAELVRLAEPNPRGDGSWMIELVPNHSEIASWSGTEREEVGKAIGVLVRDDILERKHRSFLIKDHGKLRTLAGM